MRAGALISCSAFNRHRHDAPAQYDLGRTLYPVPDCCGSDCCDAVGVEGGAGDGEAGWAVGGGGNADRSHGDCAGPEGADGSRIDSESGASDDDGGTDLAERFALGLRFAGSSDARLGAQVGHFGFDFAVTGAAAGGR